MLDFVIFAVAFVTFLVALVLYLYPGARKTGTTVPGMNPSDPKEGNLLDIQQAGSLHEFLINLHAEYGEIASFWLETQLIVSLASPKLFSEHQHVFDRPGDQFHYLRPLLGEHSIYFSNGVKARPQHAIITEVLSGAAHHKNGSVYKQISKELIDKLEKLPTEQHVPLHQYMLALSIKIVLLTLFGEHFQDPNNILDFRSQLDLVINHVDLQLYGKVVKMHDSQQKKVDQAIDSIRSKVKMLINKKVGLIAELCQKSDASLEQNVDNTVTIIFESYSVIANFLTWTLYHITKNNSVQEKLFQEISAQYNTEEQQDLSKLIYLNCVLQETLRKSCLRPFVARVQDIDVDIGGHLIPKGTPVIQALGVVLEDSKIWNNPNRFDPERFSEEQAEGRSPLAFCPFGIGNKRKCPGNLFANAVVGVIVSEIVLNLKLSSTEAQVERNFCGVITKPEEDIWITVEKRH